MASAGAGGAPLEGYVEPRPGLFVGGKPSETHLRAAKARGVGAVISLLSEDEHAAEAEQVRALGMSFVAIPVSGPDDLTETKARLLERALREHADEAVMLHCATGNRTGALLALGAYYVEGLTAARAIELGVAAGLKSLEPQVRARLMEACNATPERC